MSTRVHLLCLAEVPGDCGHCGAEWGLLCPCTALGLQRLLGWPSPLDRVSP